MWRILITVLCLVVAPAWAAESATETYYGEVADRHGDKAALRSSTNRHGTHYELRVFDEHAVELILLDLDREGLEKLRGYIDEALAGP